MASCCIKAMVALRASTTTATATARGSNSFLLVGTNTYFFPSFNNNTHKRNYSLKSSSLDPPDVARLAQTARISLTPLQVQEFGPNIHQVVDWFGQLQAVDLQSIQPSIRSDIDGDNLREDVPETFENREAIIGAIPSYEEPYIKVPKVLNKE